MSDEYLRSTSRTANSWMAWLEENGETHDEVWVEIYKKHTGVKSIAWAEIVTPVLCASAGSTVEPPDRRGPVPQRLTLRRKRSKVVEDQLRQGGKRWIADRRMRPAGLCRGGTGKGRRCRWEEA